MCPSDAIIAQARVDSAIEQQAIRRSARMLWLVGAVLLGCPFAVSMLLIVGSK